MALQIDTPYLLESYECPDQVVLGADAIIIRGTGPEPRHNPTFASGADYVDITAQENDVFIYSYHKTIKSVPLRNRAAIIEFLGSLQGTVFIDITALSHHVWAPILRTCIGQMRTTRALYIQPQGYVRTPRGQDGEIFDLSERISGVAAIPGFVSLADDFEDRTCFVPMLGFEGKRTAYILEHVQPMGNSIFPIIGLPGFRMEFPFYTFECNSRILLETQAWKNVRYAAAHNPFSAYDTLADIHSANGGSLLKIAPIGTKPHALGAFLYSLRSGRTVEFVYDFPIRRANRTTGVGKAFVYKISEFMT